ncbi:hypothetical protein Tco_0009808 [Tanacetum coccineum]
MKRLFKIDRSAQVVSSEDEGLGDQEDASKQGRKITDIDQDAEVTLVDETRGSTAEVSAAATITTEEITLAQALVVLRSAKPKRPYESTTRTTLTPIPSNIKDKGEAKMIKPEKPLKAEENKKT